MKYYYRIFSSYYYDEFQAFMVKAERWAGKKIVYPLIIRLIKLEFKLKNTGITKDWSMRKQIVGNFKRRHKKQSEMSNHQSHTWAELKLMTRDHYKQLKYFQED